MPKDPKCKRGGEAAAHQGVSWNQGTVCVVRDLKNHSVSSPCHGQGHLPVNQVALSSVQPSLVSERLLSKLWLTQGPLHAAGIEPTEEPGLVTSWQEDPLAKFSWLIWLFGANKTPAWTITITRGFEHGSQAGSSARANTPLKHQPASKLSLA